MAVRPLPITEEAGCDMAHLQIDNFIFPRIKLKVFDFDKSWFLMNGNNLAISNEP